MDKLEKYITNNRDQFDDRNPDPSIWDRIESHLPRRQVERRIMFYKWVSVAAVSLVLILSGIIAGLYMGQGSIAQNPAYAEFMEAQQYYHIQYDKKKSELSNYAYDPEVDKDLQELDKIYEELSKEFQNAAEPDKSELVNAMIQIYKTRIALLERVLGKIEQNDNEKQIHDNDEKINI